MKFVGGLVLAHFPESPCIFVPLLNVILRSSLAFANHVNALATTISIIHCTYCSQRSYTKLETITKTQCRVELPSPPHGPLISLLHLQEVKHENFLILRQSLHLQSDVMASKNLEILRRGFSLSSLLVREDLGHRRTFLAHARLQHPREVLGRRVAVRGVVVFLPLLVVVVGLV